MFGLTPFNRNSMQKKYNNDIVDLNDMIDDFFSDSFFPIRSLRNDTFKIDIKDNEKEYLIEAELPGIKKEEIKLDYNEGRLTIAVLRQEQINEEKENYIHRERKMASMQRCMYLKDIKAGTIEAKLEEGVLKITAQKEEKVDNRYKIEIQ